MPGTIVQPGNMEATDSATAPFYIVPSERVVSIEHPCIVRNFDDGIKSLGGEPQMKHVSGAVYEAVSDQVTSTDYEPRPSSIASGTVWQIPINH